MITRTVGNRRLDIALSTEETDEIYRSRERSYWEEAFCNRYAERFCKKIGLCNLPLESLPEESILLDRAYHYYWRIQNNNRSFNKTLDCVIEHMERLWKNNKIQATPPVKDILMDVRDKLRWDAEIINNIF